MKELLSRRRYRPKTIAAYIAALESLFSFCADTEPNEISFEQISEFIFYLLKRKKIALSSINLHLAAFNIFFSTFLDKKIDFQSLKPKRSLPAIPEILSPDEVNRLLSESVFTIKHRAVLSIIYSAGLDISQVMQLRVEDVDFSNKQIRIRNTDGEVVRVAILAEKLIPELQRYIAIYSPGIWFFEGNIKGTPYSPSAIQRVFKKGLTSAKISKKVTVKSLKYSYVKHMELYGVPLPTILKNIGINNTNSVYIYSHMGLRDGKLSFSPLDRITHETSKTEVDTSSIEHSFVDIQNNDEKAYLLESLKCLSARASRAAVVFAWIAAIRNIQSRCLQFDTNVLNDAIRKHHRNAQHVETIDDFETIKERYVLEASHTLGIFDKREKNVLIGCLDLRNQCGHPGNYMPSELRVAAFLEDIYKIVFSKPNPDIQQKNEASVVEDEHLPYPVEDDLPF
jgi:site-specific recombinase XerD